MTKQAMGDLVDQCAAWGLVTREADPLSIMCYEIPGAITKDGKPAPGNPYIGRAGALPEIWATGLRASVQPGPMVDQRQPAAGEPVDCSRVDPVFALLNSR